MSATYHLRIKKDYAVAVIEDLRKMEVVEFMPQEESINVPQWQIEEIRNSVKYYKEHPEELINWEDAQKKIKTD